MYILRCLLEAGLTLKSLRPCLSRVREYVRESGSRVAVVVVTEGKVLLQMPGSNTAVGLDSAQLVWTFSLGPAAKEIPLGNP